MVQILRRWRIPASACLLGVVSAGDASAQHVATDGTLGPAKVLAGPSYQITPDLGKQVGGNLFHSFGQFSLSNTPVPETATFTSTGSAGPINNVIGRVTGGSQSSIDGTIQSNITGANLYLINPNGIVFGPNASVNVSGSFHVSTADYVRFSDGVRFYSNPANGSTLTAAPPAAFGFMTASPPAITINGSQHLVPIAGASVGITGGPITISQAILSAPAGRIHVTSVASAGEVPVAHQAGGRSKIAAHGPVTISQSSLNISGPAGGTIGIRAGTLAIASGEINADNVGAGRGAQIILRSDGTMTLGGGLVIHANAEGIGSGGDIRITAGTLAASGAAVASDTFGPMNGGNITLAVAGTAAFVGGSGTTGLAVLSGPSSTGSAGNIKVTTGALELSNGATISSLAKGAGNGGSVTVASGALTMLSRAQIASNTAGAGAAGNVSVTTGALSINDPGTQISSSTSANGRAGDVSVNAASATISNLGEVNAGTTASGNGGSVRVSVSGSLSIIGPPADNPFLTGISSVADPGSTGNGGSVIVNAGKLSIAGYAAEISSSTLGAGNAGDVAVQVAGPLSITGPVGKFPTGVIAATLNSPPFAATGSAGSVSVTAQNISLTGGGSIASTTAGIGFGGFVQVTADGQLSLSGGGGIIASATSTASGNAGFVDVSAPQITVTSGAQIASTTAGTGGGGFVAVTTPGALALEGLGNAGTGIAASATGPQSGDGGKVVVSANSLTINGGAQIASSTAGPGDAGAVVVLVTGAATLTGSATDGTPSRITAEARQGSSGQAGGVGLSTGGMLTLAGGAEVTSSTAGAGNGGVVVVGPSSAFAPCLPSCVSQGPLSLSGGGGILALASATASGNAGSVTINAPQITVTSGAEIVSTTAGTGAGGSVGVTTPGALVLDGMGNRNTQIAASATGPSSGSGGSVTVAANTLTVGGGAQIASSTAGPGRGGDVNVVVAGDITLPDRGPQITAQSSGSGDAGSITLSAARLLMSNGGAISTEAETSTASGGNITLNVRDFLYLVSGQISTSVNGETGNGGNITIDPQLAILNHSSIIAQAIEGHGGNITITADQFIPSTDSIISATSQLGISGTVVINGPRVDVNGALVVLSSELRGRAEVLREACAARGGQPISSFVEAGRGGLPQDPEATLPALYIAGRDVNPNTLAVAGTAQSSGALQTTVHLTMRCE